MFTHLDDPAQPSVPDRMLQDVLRIGRRQRRLRTALMFAVPVVALITVGVVAGPLDVFDGSRTLNVLPATEPPAPDGRTDCDAAAAGYNKSDPRLEARTREARPTTARNIAKWLEARGQVDNHWFDKPPDQPFTICLLDGDFSHLPLPGPAGVSRGERAELITAVGDPDTMLMAGQAGKLSLDGLEPAPSTTPESTPSSAARVSVSVSPAAPRVGEKVTIVATLEAPHGAPLDTYKLDWGNGQGGARTSMSDCGAPEYTHSETSEYAYDEPGTYTITVYMKASGCDRPTDEATGTATITVRPRD